ncbi:MAG: HD domain-containing protein [Spirochaetales bacterium]|nr:HD domain-containing protein [Spirochaetales bacterium]
MKKNEWIPVRKSHLKYYENIELFYKSPSGNIVLYKPVGMPFTDESIANKPFIGDLYIKPEDKSATLEATQKGFNEQLIKDIQNKTLNEVRDSLFNVVDETLAQPRAGGLKAMTGTVQSIVEGFSSQKGIIKNLVRISYNDYTTALHSINVMALTVGYCYFTGKSTKVTEEYALAALLHDVGKTEVPKNILTASRPLTDEEYNQIKAHSSLGADILDGYKEEPIRKAKVGALEHHEKLDGSGYPHGKTDITECGRILSIVDCYEAITNDDRPYRSAMQPLKALALLKEDMEKGKFDRSIFTDFAYSLTDFK